MRRVLSSLLLALLVVCAQQAALVHEIGHGLGHGSGSVAATAALASPHDSDSSDNGAYCDKCFQFAHVSGAAAGFVPVPAMEARNNESAHTRPAAELAADAPQSRSRGPPFVL